MESPKNEVRNWKSAVGIEELRSRKWEFGVGNERSE